MAGRLNPGGLGWRKGSNPPAPASPRVVTTPGPSSAPPVAGPREQLDHTEALERWASTAPERPSWMLEPEPPLAPVAASLPAHLVESSLRTFAPAAPTAPAPDDEAAAIPDFDDATDRFAQFALRAAESQSLFSRDDYTPPQMNTVVATGADAWVASPPLAEPASAPVEDFGATPSTAGWRPDDVHVSAADMDADAMRLEMLAARAAEARESRGDFTLPASVQPLTTAPPKPDDAPLPVSGWRRDTVAVSAEEFDADAARLESLASRASEYRPPALEPEPVPEATDERVSFWRQDAVVVTAEEFDADAARLENLAARGPLFAVSETRVDEIESTPFWEQQERARHEAEARAAAEIAARDAAANDDWQARWERMAKDAARRGDTPDPLGL